LDRNQSSHKKDTKMEKIIVSALISANLRRVWDHYTMPEHITQWNFADPSWHCPRAFNDLQVGGTYSARMEARDGSFGFDFEAIYTDVQPLQAFSYEFGGRMARVEFHEREQETEVVVTFDPETENPIDLQKEGWQSILNSFKSYSEAQG